jgi:hypothetical protein
VTPIPRPGQSAGGGASRPSPARAGGGDGTGSSSAPPPTSSPRPRPSSKAAQKQESLEVKVARLYKMLGTMIQPFGRFYPVLTPVGNNMKSFAEEAAEAWLELAAEDKRVMEMLESMTKASTWGNVLGIHFAIFASSIPGGEMMTQAMQMPDLASPDFQNDPIAAARAAGMPEEAIQEAIQLAGRFQGAANTPARDQSSGGPGDTVRVPPAPEFSPQAQPAPSAAPPPVQSTAPSTKAAIVSPAELGVVQPGAQGAFPQSGPPNGTV